MREGEEGGENERGRGEREEVERETRVSRRKREIMNERNKRGGGTREQVLYNTQTYFK